MTSPLTQSSRVLQQKIPGYARWASEKRAWVEECERHRPASLLSDLNEATRAAFELLTREQEATRALVEAQNRKLQILENGQKAILAGQNEILAFIRTRPPPAQQAAPQAAPPPPATPALPSINDVLGQRPVEPPIATKMPTSFVRVEEEWRNMELGKYARASLGKTPVAQAYKKRKYLYGIIVSRQATGGQSFAEAAASLDRERGQQTLSQFFREHHGANDTIVRRQKRTRPPSNNDETPPRRVVQRPAVPRVRPAPQGHAPYVNGLPFAQWAAQQDPRGGRTPWEQHGRQAPGRDWEGYNF